MCASQLPQPAVRHDAKLHVLAPFMQPSNTIVLPSASKVLLGACMLQQGATYRQIVVPAGSEVSAACGGRALQAARRHQCKLLPCTQPLSSCVCSRWFTHASMHRISAAALQSRQLACGVIIPRPVPAPALAQPSCPLPFTPAS